MRALVLQVLGAGGITAGAALLHPSAGLIVGGIFLSLFGLAMEREG